MVPAPNANSSLIHGETVGGLNCKGTPELPCIDSVQNISSGQLQVEEDLGFDEASKMLVSKVLFILQDNCTLTPFENSPSQVTHSIRRRIKSVENLER